MVTARRGQRKFPPPQGLAWAPRGQYIGQGHSACITQKCAAISIRFACHCLFSKSLEIGPVGKGQLDRRPVNEHPFIYKQRPMGRTTATLERLSISEASRSIRSMSASGTGGLKWEACISSHFRTRKSLA